MNLKEIALALGLIAGGCMPIQTSADKQTRIDNQVQTLIRMQEANGENGEEEVLKIKFPLKDAKQIDQLVYSTVKELTGEDYSYMKINILPDSTYNKKHREKNAETIGRHDTFRRAVDVRQGPVWGTLYTIFHEFGHEITKQGDHLPFQQISEIFRNPKGESYEQVKAIWEKKITRDDAESSLMEEAAAEAFARWALSKTCDKYSEKGKLGAYIFTTKPDKELNVSTVADQMCTDLFYSLRESNPDVSCFDLQKKIFEFLNTTTYKDIRKHITKETLDRSQEWIKKELDAKEIDFPMLYTNPVDALFGKYGPTLRCKYDEIMKQTGKYKGEPDVDDDPTYHYDGGKFGRGIKLAKKLDEALTKQYLNKNTLLVLNSGACHMYELGTSLQKTHNVYFFSEVSYVEDMQTFLDPPNLCSDFYQFYKKKEYAPSFDSAKPNAIIFGDDHTKDFKNFADYAPTADELKQKGITNIVLGQERLVPERGFRLDQLRTIDRFQYSKNLYDYIADLEKQGIKVEAVGIEEDGDGVEPEAEE